MSCPPCTNDCNQGRTCPARNNNAIIEMAKDSGIELYGLGKDRARFVYHLEAFAKLVAQRTWVGLTDEEIDQGLVRTNYAMQTAGAWRDGVEWATKQLREKNNG